MQHRHLETNPGEWSVAVVDSLLERWQELLEVAASLTTIGGSLKPGAKNLLRFRDESC